MKKLLYIQNFRLPTEKAHGIQIMKMCEVFAQVAEVELVVPHRFNKIKEDPFKYYGIKKNFQIKKLPCLDLIPLDKYIGYLALWVESITFAIPVFIYLLFKKVDIIYTRDKFLIFISLFRKNLVFEAHTFPKNYFLYRWFIKRLKALVVISKKLGELFPEKEIKTLVVAPDGVDLEMFRYGDTSRWFEVREYLGLPKDKKIVLYTGHLYDWKGVQTLAEASSCLPKNTEVYFVGGTIDDVQRFKAKNSKFKTIHIIGHRPYSEIPSWLAAADVLVIPNSGKKDISRYWTSPLKMLEYMASKKPIVASDLPSLREILNEENAVLVKPDNPAILAEGIKKVLQNPDLAGRISEKSFSDVKEYTWRKRMKKILPEIDEK